jgi:hypothetical protein
MSNEKANLTNKWLAIAGTVINLITIFANTMLYGITGGFSAGKQLTEIKAEMRMIRHELKTSNQMQDCEVPQVTLRYTCGFLS